jgi:hypothetical protein
VKFVGSLVATEASLADGTPLAGGQEYDLSPEQRQDKHNARLISEGQLLAVNNTDKAREEASATLKSLAPAPAAAADSPPPPTPPETGGS